MPFEFEINVIDTTKNLNADGIHYNYLYTIEVRAKCPVGENYHFNVGMFMYNAVTGETIRTQRIDDKKLGVINGITYTNNTRIFQTSWGYVNYGVKANFLAVANDFDTAAFIAQKEITFDNTGSGPAPTYDALNLTLAPTTAQQGTFITFLAKTQLNGQNVSVGNVSLDLSIDGDPMQLDMVTNAQGIATYTLNASTFTVGSHRVMAFEDTATIPRFSNVVDFTVTAPSPDPNPTPTPGGGTSSLAKLAVYGGVAFVAYKAIGKKLR